MLFDESEIFNKINTENRNKIIKKRKEGSKSRTKY